MTYSKAQNNAEKAILRAMEAWQKAFSAPTITNIVALYAQEASLWGTLSPLRKSTPDAINDYFTAAFIFTDRSVTFQDHAIRFYGELAICSGTYTFTLTKEGEKLILPSRYSCVYAKQNQNWLIVEHHSSPMPLD